MVEPTPTPVKCARCGHAPAVVAIASGKVRHSAAVPGLTYETAVTAGVVYLTFRFGAAFETVAIQDGRAIPVDCSDRFGIPACAARAVADFTRALAARLAGKAVA